MKIKKPPRRTTKPTPSSSVLPSDTPSGAMLLRKLQRTAKPNAVIQATGRLMDVAGLTLYLGTKDGRWARRRVDRRTIPFIRLGGRLYFDRNSIDQWLAGLPGCDVSEAKKNLNRFNGDE